MKMENWSLKESSNTARAWMEKVIKKELINKISCLKFKRMVFYYVDLLLGLLFLGIEYYDDGNKYFEGEY